MSSLREFGRLFCVACILTMVLSIAVPIGPLESLERFLKPKLGFFGIDVSNTPLTADMLMMYDPDGQKSLYLSTLDVVYLTDKGEKLVPWSRLPFYGWRVPSILFVENISLGLGIAAEVYALCYTLNKLEGPGQAFRVNSNLSSKIASKLGLNQWYLCPIVISI